MKIVILNSVGRSLLYDSVVRSAQDAGYEVVEAFEKGVKFVVGMFGDKFPDGVPENIQIILKLPDNTPVTSNTSRLSPMTLRHMEIPNLPPEARSFSPLTLMHLEIPNLSLCDFFSCSL